MRLSNSFLLRSPSWTEAPFWFCLHSDSFPSDGKVSCYLSHRAQTRAFNQAAFRGFVCPKLTKLVICNDFSSPNKFSSLSWEIIG